MAEEDSQAVAEVRENAEKAPPSFREVLSLVVASLGILYPFGIAVIQRQLTFAYNLDTATAWHAASLVSQTEIVVHAIQLVIALPTLLLAGLYLIYVFTGATWLTNASRFAARMKEREAQRKEIEVLKGELELCEKEQGDLEESMVAIKQEVINDDLQLFNFENILSTLKSNVSTNPPDSDMELLIKRPENLVERFRYILNKSRDDAFEKIAAIENRRNVIERSRRGLVKLEGDLTSKRLENLRAPGRYIGIAAYLAVAIFSLSLRSNVPWYAYLIVSGLVLGAARQ